MEAIQARQLTVDNKVTSEAELKAAILSAITDRAKKGWKNIDVTNIVEPYNTIIVSSVYTDLRTLGYNVNVVHSNINW